MDITTEAGHDGGSTLRLVGDFDVRSTCEVRTAIYAALDGRERDVVVDLSAVDAVDLTALRVLAYATREAGKAGHHLTLRGCGPAVRRMLHLSHLRHAVEVEVEAEVEAAAAGAWEPGPHRRGPDGPVGRAQVSPITHDRPVTRR